MENIKFTQAAKDILTANQEAIKTALDLAANSKDRLTSAAQVVALTAYKAFETNGATIPAANIGAFLNLTTDETKKLKQYVSRAAYVWGYKGKSYNMDTLTLKTPHDDFMTGDNPPSITSTYKDIKAHEKAIKQAQEAATQARAMELKAAQAFIDSGATLPDSVVNADELLTMARLTKPCPECKAALDLGMGIVEQANIEAVNDAACADLLTQIKGALDKLYAMNSDTANDALATIHAYIEGLAAQSVEEAAKQAA